MPSPGDLLDAAFVQELVALRRRLTVRARSGAGGDHLARRRGGSAEFQEHRPYTAGDDLRRMDWLAFARTGDPVLKQFRAEEDVILRVLVDESASLGVGDPPKLSVAARFAAAVSYLALAESERAQLLVGGPGLVRSLEPVRGQGGLPRVLRALEEMRQSGARGGTNLAAAIDAAVMRSPRPGMLVVISDFLDGGPWASSLRRAASAGHDLAVVQILAEEEVRPVQGGDFALEDAETGEVVEVTIDGAVLAAYRARLEKLWDELRGIARRHRSAYVRVEGAEALSPALRRFVTRGVD